MTESLEFGLILMISGMGTVYVLLAMLVYIVSLVSRFSRWLDPTPQPAPAAAVPMPAAPAVDAELVSVIGAAVKAHRQRRKDR
jgi:oxaloacetate decarboxylase gamma subunit